MAERSRRTGWLLAAGSWLLATAALGEAHKPITSKYTFNEHVLPILRDRCASCHVDRGPAPMSLLTYADARPWAESIRAELVAGHMPPAQAESDAGPFLNARLLPPRDLDTVLTWATGGTPEGAPRTEPTAADRPDWPLGAPELVLPVPRDVTLLPGEIERTETFRLRSPQLDGRPIRAVDLKPGTPAIVRRAVISVSSPNDSAIGREPILALWSPDRDVIATRDAAFAVPRGAELIAEITYRKTWKYENVSASDRSEIGVYFADDRRAPEIVAVPVEKTALVTEDMRALAMRPEIEEGDREVVVSAALPDGSRVLLLRCLRQAQWPQRFWYARGVALPRGTRLEASAPVVVEAVRTKF